MYFTNRRDKKGEKEETVDSKEVKKLNEIIFVVIFFKMKYTYKR